MRKIISGLSICFFFSLYLLIPQVKSTMAQYKQPYGQYGVPAPAEALIIDKTVGKPSQTKGGVTSLEFVDNLSPADPRFHPGEQVVFRLRVKNISSSQINNVGIIDFLPSFIEPVEIPGSFNSNNRTINFSAGNFAPNEEKLFFLTTKVVAVESLPADKDLICLINRARVFTAGDPDEDTARFCIEKQPGAVVPSAMPAAGVESGLIPPVVAILAFLFGSSLQYYCIKKKK
jgi:uncharacterized repeat protein (TIGR01451 family)